MTVPELQIFPGVGPVTSESSQRGGAFFCDLGRIYAVTSPRDSLYSQHLALMETLRSGLSGLQGDTQCLRHPLTAYIAHSEIS